MAVIQKQFLGLVMLGAPLAAQTANSSQETCNPSITVIGNAIGRLDDRRVRNDAGDSIGDRFNLREVELDIRAPIDSFASGVLIFAAEAETPGEYEVEVEEGYVRLHGLPGVERMPGGLAFRIGRFRPAVGQYNRLHTHQLPHTTRPFSLQTFLGEEGFVHNGLEATVELPGFAEDSSFGLEAAVLNGGSIAIGEDNGGEDPAWSVRFHAALDLGEGHDLELGVSHYEGRRDVAGTLAAHLYAFDGAYRWQFSPDREESVVVGLEGYLADLERTMAPASTPAGGFAYVQYQFDHHWDVGARFDCAEMLADDSMQTKSYSLFATYRFSDHLRVRAGWEHFDSDDPGLDGLDTAWLEFNFVFGSHAAHQHSHDH